MVDDRTKGEHPLVRAAWKTFLAAEDGLYDAFCYFGSTDVTNRPKIRLALTGIATSCDALKSAANALNSVIGHADRTPTDKPKVTGDE